MYFHSKMAWPPSTYGETDHHWTWLKMRARAEQLQKTSGADVLSSREKKIRKTLMGGGVASTPLVRPTVKNSRKPVVRPTVKNSRKNYKAYKNFM